MRKETEEVLTTDEEDRFSSRFALINCIGIANVSKAIQDYTEHNYNVVSITWTGNVQPPMEGKLMIGGLNVPPTPSFMVIFEKSPTNLN